MVRRFKRAGDIKVAVVGYSGAYSMGRAHLEDVKKAGMKPVAVVEIERKRLEIAEQEFPGIETYTSLTGMLKKSEANLVTLITPHNTHARLGLQCLRAGRHVVSEKPFAVTTEECDAMIREAKKRRLMLSTYHNRHWDGCIMEAVKRIRRGVIGDVYRIEAHMGRYGTPRDWWRSSKSISGGILYDWGVHFLEYSLQLIDSDIVEVSGYAKEGVWARTSVWKKDANEDEALAVIRFRNGAWLTLCITTLDSNPRPGRLDIAGTRGSYVMHGGSFEIIQVRGNRTIVTKGKNPPDKWDRYYRNVANHLVRGERLVIGPEWARRPIHILDLAGRSAREGKALKAKYK